LAEDLHEIHEQAEKAREHPGLAGATFTMSLLAVLVAAVSVIGHRAHTATILNTEKASDSWAQYQAKSIRRSNYLLFMDLLSVAHVNDPAQAEQVKAKYKGELQRYEGELKDITETAQNYEKQAEHSERKAARYDLGEVCLEAALVITSITLITHRKLFWAMGSTLAAVGIIIAITGSWAH
jgi:hypothetical protein